MKKSSFCDFDIEKYLALEIFDKSNDAIIITDKNIKIVAINNAFTKITGYKKEEVLGKNPSILQSKWHDTSFYKELWKSVEKKGYFEGEIKDRRKNGELYISKAYLFKVENEGKINYIGISKDITSIYQNHEKVKKLAFYDHLTGLPNRLYFEESLKNLFLESKRYKKSFALLFVDLDNFKYVNDTFGHLVGDKLLEEVSSRLTNNVRESDIVSRLAGDEFTIILKDVNSSSSIANISNKIIDSLKDSFLIDGHEIRIGSSIGISISPEDTEDYDELIKNADIAMYNSKENGKNRFTFYCKDMNDAVIKKYQIENYLKQSLLEGDFYLEYQPLIQTIDEKILSYEALVRWNHPVLGKIYPNDFIPYCEDNGMIIKLGHWIVDRAFFDINEMKKKKREFHLSINISAKQLNDITFSKYVESKIKQYDVDSKNVVFEITESILLENNKNVKENIHKLKEQGISFALDDFGTGYSSMNYLKDFPISTIKIDKSFILSMFEDKNNLAIVDSILYLSKLLGKTVIAEGIENSEQMQHLKEKECNVVQGFYFSKPLGINDL